MIRAFLGGSFDPVHDGHTAMAQYLLSTGQADVVHVVPAWLSPHKDRTAASATHRLAMVRLAFGEQPQLVIETMEIDSGKACFTVQTMAALQRQYESCPWLLIIGGDNLAAFQQWHQPERLQALAEIVVLGRNEADLGAGAIDRAGLNQERVSCLPDFDQPVSSTGVRGMLASGPVSEAALVAGGISPAVAEYILDHQLYFPDWNGENFVPDSD